MKKIGTTTSGTVIVEMTAAQFEALSQFQGASTPQPPVATMSIAERIAYARERIAKLSPKKKDGVARSLSAMFQFTRGISEADTQDVISRLKKEKFFSIDDTGRVTFKGANKSPEPTRTAVTPRAVGMIPEMKTSNSKSNDARVAPAARVAHL